MATTEAPNDSAVQGSTDASRNTLLSAAQNEARKTADNIKTTVTGQAEKHAVSLVNKALAQTGLDLAVDKIPHSTEELKAEAKKQAVTQADKAAQKIVNSSLKQFGLDISLDKVPHSAEELKAEAKKQAVAQADKAAQKIVNSGLKQFGLDISLDKVPHSTEELKAEAKKQAVAQADKAAQKIVNSGLKQIGLDINVGKIPHSKEELKDAAVAAATPLLKKYGLALVSTILRVFGIRLPVGAGKSAMSRLTRNQAVQELKASTMKQLWGILRSRLPGGPKPQASLKVELINLWRETRAAAKDSAGNVTKSLWKRVARVAGIVLCGPVLVVLIVLGAAFGFLQTQYGQNFLQEKLNAILEPSGIVISDLGGMIPISNKASVTMKDADGTWLEVKNCLVAMDFSDIPNALGLTVKVESGHLYRLPPASPQKAEEVPTEEDSSSFDVRLKLEVLTRVTNVIPPWVPGVALRNLQVSSFQVDRAVYDTDWQHLSNEERSDPSQAGALTVYFKGDAAVMPDTVERWISPVTTAELGVMVLPVPAVLPTDTVAAAFSASPFLERSDLPLCELISGLSLDAVTAGVSLSGTLKDPQFSLEARIGNARAAGRALSHPVVHVCAPAGWMPGLLGGKTATFRLGTALQVDSAAMGFNLLAETSFDGLSPKIRLRPAASGPGLHVSGDVRAVIPSSLMETAKSLAPGADEEPDPWVIKLPVSTAEGTIALDISDFRLFELFVPDMRGAGSLNLALNVTREEGLHAVKIDVAAQDFSISRKETALIGLSELGVHVDLANLNLTSGIDLRTVQSSLNVAGKQIATGAVDPFDIDLKTEASLAALTLDLAGTGGVKSALHASLTRDQENKTAKFELSGKDISIRGKGAELAGLNALDLVCDVTGIDLDALVATSKEGDTGADSAAFNLEALHGNVELKARHIRTGAVAPINLDLKTGGSFDSLTLALASTGGVKSTIDLAGSARERTASLKKLNVSVPKFKCGLKLISPADIRFSQEMLLPVEVKGFNLQLEPAGKVELAGAYGPETLQAALRVVHLNTKPWQRVVEAIPSALINVDTKITGSLRQPAGSVSVKVDNLTLEGLPSISTAVTSKIESSAQGAKITADVKLGEATRRAFGISRLDIRGGITIPRKGEDLNFGAAMESPIEANVDYTGTLSQIWAILRQPTRRVSGELALKAKAAGTPSRPEFNADLTLKKGSFTDTEFGLQLRDIAVAVKAACQGKLENTAVKLDLSLNDGRKSRGTITARGTVHPVSMRNTDIRVRIMDFSPLRRRDIRAVLSGDVQMTGLLTAPDVQGIVGLDKGSVLIEELNLPASGVTTLELVEGPKEHVLAVRASRGKEAETTGIDVPGSLDLGIRVRKLFVEGYGLDTEWKANLRASGPLSNVGLRGEVKAVRGRLNLFNRKFNMEEGTVSFVGGTEPFLNLKMVTKAQSVEAALRLQGSLTNMKSLGMHLESDPSMPEDDVLSYILFGKPANELSQFQMLQLARSMAMLVAFGTSSGTTSLVKDMTSLDVVNIDQDEHGNASLEMGKYLFEDVYAGIERSADGNAETSAVVRWELGRQTSAEFETGGEDTSLGVKWKLTY